MTSRIADGSNLPAYTKGGSLHREGERRVHFPESTIDFRGDLPDVRDEGTYLSYAGRVHVSKTNDAELLADVWGVLFDQEPLSLALAARFKAFVADHLGEGATTALSERSSCRFRGDEASSADEDDLRRYVYGHTGA